MRIGNDRFSTATDIGIAHNVFDDGLKYETLSGESVEYIYDGNKLVMIKYSDGYYEKYKCSAKTSVLCENGYPNNYTKYIRNRFGCTIEDMYMDGIKRVRTIHRGDSFESIGYSKNGESVTHRRVYDVLYADNPYRCYEDKQIGWFDTIYDGADKILKHTDSKGNIDLYKYHVDNSHSIYHFNKVILLAQEYKNKKYWEITTFDKNGNKLTYKNSNGFWNKSKYDKKGNKISYTDSTGYNYNAEYDDNDDKISFDNSDGHTCEFIYDESGNNIFSKRRIGEVTLECNMTYDCRQNMLTRETKSFMPSFSSRFLKILKPESVDEAEVIYEEWTYDSNNNVVSHTIDGVVE